MNIARPRSAALRAVLAACAGLALMACSTGPSRASDAKVCETRGASNGELRHDGANRSYRLFLPPGAADKPLPLVIAMHGGWGTGSNLAEQSGLDRAAREQGFAVVYPNGTWRSWNAGECCGRAANTNVDDVGFIAAIKDKLAAESCIDGDRVYGTGFSNGAMLTHRIACERPDLFRAIAPVAGGPMVENCASDKPVPALLIVGREDERIPWDGGEFDGTHRPSIADQVGALAKRNQCGEASSGVLKRGGATCEQRDGCGRGSVVWCVLDGVGHQWPGGQTLLPRLLGKNSNDYDASNEILRFFKAN